MAQAIIPAPALVARPMPTAPLPPADLDAVRAMFTALRQQAAASGRVLREPPPEPVSCCGRGCNGCVWESYYAAAACWQEDALQTLAA